MESEVRYSISLASVAEDLFVEVFCDAFGPEKTQYLLVQTVTNKVKSMESEWQKQPEDVIPLALFLASQPDFGPTVQSFSLMGRDN